MQPTLLRTKLHTPQLPQNTLPRPHLLALLDQGLNGKATLVSAPAGFGKTSLVVMWLNYLLHEQASPAGDVKIGWLALDTSDNQPIRFLHYVVAAIRTSFPAACAAVEAYMNAVQATP